MKRRFLVAGAAALAGLAALSGTALARGPARYIGPTAQGAGDGANWGNRGALPDLDRFVAEVGPGGVVYIALHLGPYSQTDAITLRSSGAAGNPVTIVGVSENLSLANPINAPIVGSRKQWRAPESRNPVDASRFDGNSFIVLDKSSHIVIKNLFLERFGRTFSANSGTDVRFEDVTLYNVRTGWYTDSKSSAQNFKIVRAVVIGFSKEAVRYHGTCRNWTIEDFSFDSRWQDKDAHARGIYGDDKATNLLVRKGSIKNCYFSPRDRNGFRQGDGISNEIGNTGWRIQNTNISGCTDAGVDLKADDTTLEGCDSRHNKRSYRLWGDNTKLIDCTSYEPSTPFEDELRFVRHVWFGSIRGRPRPSFQIARLVAAGGPSAMTAFEGYSLGPGGDVKFLDCDLRRLPEQVTLTNGEKWVWEGI